MSKFFNHFEQKYEDNCVAQGHAGRWYICIGFAGANSRINNSIGYETQAKAETACLYYQAKGDNV